jgi:hypothetical protein
MADNSKWADKTMWVGTDLNPTKWVAFPVLELDGINESIIVRAKDYRVVYTDMQGHLNHGVMPQDGVYVLKSTPAPTTGEDT